MDTKELRFKEEAFAIIGAAMEVHSTLGLGFLESVYAEAFAREMAERSIPFRREVDIPVFYKGKPLDKLFRADFVIHGKILVELKALRALGNPEHAQLLNYLKASGLPLGMLFNFGSFPKLEWVRLAN